MWQTDDEVKDARICTRKIEAQYREAVHQHDQELDELNHNGVEIDRQEIELAQLTGKLDQEKLKELDLQSSLESVHIDSNNVRETVKYKQREIDDQSMLIRE